MSDVVPYAVVGTFLLAILAYVVKLTWQVGRIEIGQQQYTDAQIDNLREDLGTKERECLARQEATRQEHGEMGHALRTKIHEVETWSRDQFVRKESFENAVSRLEKTLERSIDKLEVKIDKALDRLPAAILKDK